LQGSCLQKEIQALKRKTHISLRRMGSLKPSVRAVEVSTHFESCGNFHGFEASLQVFKLWNIWDFILIHDSFVVKWTLRFMSSLARARKIPDTYFCWSLGQPQGHNTAWRIRLIEKKNQ
jgi:hypothetical protein